MLESLVGDILITVNEFINSLIVNLLDAVFWPESTMTISAPGWGTVSLGNINFAPLFAMLRDVGIGLITLKFLKKGFDVYIGWTDGDKDNDVGHLVMNFARAIFTALAFNVIYGFIVGLISTLLLETLNALTAGATPYFENIDINLIAPPDGLVFYAMLLVLFVILIVVYFRLLIMGLHLLMLRAAFPIACAGLIDNDKGIFKNFMQKFVMISVTAFAMIFFFRFSLLLVMNANPFWGLAAAMAALKTPDTLREFMIGYGGTGGLGRASMATQQTVVAARAIVSLVKR